MGISKCLERLDRWNVGLEKLTPPLLRSLMPKTPPIVRTVGGGGVSTGSSPLSLNPDGPLETGPNCSGPCRKRARPDDVERDMHLRADPPSLGDDTVKNG